ncbi:hypothetical protein NC651_023840 [Populus alba x Populus x berolinensis]|nr:hypothetical protein NC651_023840 [Populus alba x Populus x berolinensis]
MVPSFVWTRVISTRVSKNSKKAPTRYKLKESLSRNNLHVKRIFEAEYIAKVLISHFTYRCKCLI